MFGKCYSKFVRALNSCLKAHIYINQRICNTDQIYKVKFRENEVEEENHISHIEQKLA